jgi:hypothetical protein
MKSFKKFMAESATGFDFAAFKSLSNISSDKRNYVKPERYEEAIDKMKAALEAKQIYKPDFEEIKYAVTRFLEKQEDNLRFTDYNEEIYKTEPRAADIPSSSWNLKNSAKQALHWKKFGNKYPKLVKFTETAAQINDAMDQLKGMLVAGRKPKPADPNKPAAFVKPMASIDSSKKIMTILRAAVDSIRAEYEVFMKKNIQREFDNVSKFYNKDTKKFEFPKENARDLNRLAYDFYEPAGGYQQWKVRSNVDDVIVKMAKARVEDILSQFVAKNTSKLALIVQKKNITDHRVLSNSLRNGILENDMLFKFGDGSSFKIYSKVEYSQSKYGKPFLKFPTRFADVVLVDGTKMKGPSEEKMIKEF